MAVILFFKQKLDFLIKTLKKDHLSILKTPNTSSIMAENLDKYAKEDFEDINIHEKPTKADLDFIEDHQNFEDQIDDEMNRQDKQKFTNDILFCVQELGSVKLYHNNEIFMKGQHCEDSLKDLNKFCKNDDADKPITKLELGKWNVLTNQLIPILVTQP